MDKPRILIVDDEETLCEAVKFNLDEAGYEADIALSAEEALSMPLDSYSLILLDIMMGDISGTRLAAILKKRPDTARIPIIFCTARDSEDDMVSGLELGADDYITKPYSVRNLLARIRTVLRRTASAPSATAPCGASLLTFGGLVLSADTKTCTVDGVPVKMPRKEFEILRFLMTHRGRVFSRAELLGNIWPDEVVVTDRVVDVNITRLRSKLGAYGRHIVTRSGYGYGFED